MKTEKAVDYLAGQFEAKKPPKIWFVSTLFRGEIAGRKKKIRASFKNVEKEMITSLL